MPTRKEAEEYKKRIEKTLTGLAKWNTDSPLKDKLIDDYLDKWKAAHEVLLDMGLPLEVSLILCAVAVIICIVLVCGGKVTK